MPDAEPGQLPPGLDLLWGRRERGKRGPRPGLSADAVTTAAFTGLPPALAMVQLTVVVPL